MKDIPPKSMRRLRRSLQCVTQDPFSSLDPRKSIYDIVVEGLNIHKMCASERAKKETVARMLDMVGIRPDFMYRFPHEFSGGQRQRICIARALAVQPNFVVCDEVVSALDVSIQAQIVTLMMSLQEKLGLTYIFIGHDLSVVKHISDTVMVLYLGKVVEMTDADELYENPLHPYTKALISAVPIPDPEADMNRERIILKGETPSPMHPPRGCNFCTRCMYADDRCRNEEPPMVDAGGGHFVACHKAEIKGGSTS